MPLILKNQTMFNKNTLINAIIISIALTFSFSLNAEQSDIGWLDSTIRNLTTDVSTLKNLRVNGFVRAQYMHASSEGMESTLSGTFPEGTKDIFKIRSGRLRINYNSGMVNYVLQLNATENVAAFMPIEAFIEAKDPWLNMFSIRCGMFKPNISQELLYPSDLRYGNEPAVVVQKFMPLETDIGFHLMIKHPQFPLSLTTGIFNGNSIAPENDNRKNFTARLMYDDTFMKGKFRMLLAAATYQGGVYQGNPNVYSMNGNTFSLNSDPANVGKQAERNYYIFGTTLQYYSPIGKTWLNAEFWTGTQTGSAASVNSPRGDRPSGDSYIRPFRTIFGLLAHEIQGTNTALAVKCDHFNPNTDVSGDEIGAANSYTGIPDIAYTTLSYGLIFTPTNHLRFSVWYDMPINEKTQYVSGYTENRNNNLLTFMMQVRF